MQISARQLKWFPLFLLYEIASYLSNDAYLPAMPLIRLDLNTSDDMIRHSLSAWFLGGCLVQLLVGPISDHIGRRKVLLSGGVVFVLSTIACGLATNANWLIGLRFIEGTTIATMAVTGYATIHEMFDSKQAIKTIAFINSISVLAPAFGPLFGALILQWHGWQMIFYALALWSFLPILLLYWDMPETAQVSQKPLQLNTVLGSYKRILLNLKFMQYLFASRTIFSAMIVWLSAGPFLMYETYKMDSLHFGLAQTFVFGAYIAGTRLNSALLDRLQLQTMLWLGWGLCISGAVYALTYALVGNSGFYPIMPGLMLITAGAGLSMPIYSRLAIDQSDEPMGPKVAMTTFSMTLFGVLATVMVSIFFSGSLLSMIAIISSCLIAGFMTFCFTSCDIPNILGFKNS